MTKEREVDKMGTNSNGQKRSTRTDGSRSSNTSKRGYGVINESAVHKPVPGKGGKGGKGK